MPSEPAAITDLAASPATKGGLVPKEPVLRRLAWMTLTSSFGNGLFLPISVLYFTRIVGIDTTRVGLGFTLAGLAGVAAGLPAGRASDRWGSRRVVAVLWVGAGLTLAAYTLVDGYTGFLVVGVCFGALNQASFGVRGALMADVLPVATRVEARGYLRTVTNVAMGLGGAMGAIALHVDTRIAYSALILLSAVTYLVPALMVIGLPLTDAASLRMAEQSDTPAESSWRAVRDRPYLALTVLNSVMLLQISLLDVALPLWIVQRTEAPRWSVALLVIVNCALVALLQVRAARGVAEVPGAVRAMGRAGLLLAASCAVFALSAGLSPAWAVTVLIAGAVIQVFAEILSAAAGWTLGYELADARAHGVYQGVFASGMSVSTMVGPILVTMTAVEHGKAGWALLGVLFATAGLAIRPVVRWAAHGADWRGEADGTVSAQ
ncbi:MFS transporter (plasmid) [Streptomyces sp. NBC_01216]|uniref:MFS transporter n=1 Tax=Streptomyces sp. NBC_01216 TaxID=2903778 RepID=UPI002E0E3108|nr:MFS transporter [Streptomyces sp. NBC_01216]